MRRALLIAAALLMTACTDSEDTDTVVYVAVGDSITAGTGLLDPGKEAFPQLFRQALPADARMTSLGIPGSTVADALQKQAAKAVAEQPTLVTVLLGVNDLIRFVPAATYEAQLGDLVRQLRRDGKTTVLLGNIPVLDRLPVVARLGIENDVVNAAVDAYNAVIGRVAVKEGAVLVDLHAEPFDPAFVGADGFHPSAAGHKAVAAAFAAAYNREFATVSR